MENEEYNRYKEIQDAQTSRIVSILKMICWLMVIAGTVTSCVVREFKH